MGHKDVQKTIAKNTIFLYMRMIVVMFVSLYTSRVILDELGIDDYGIYNIVGSIVVSFAFVRNSLMSSTQRFLSFELGKKDGDSNKVFSMSINIHVVIAFIILVLLETLGVWFFYHVIKIPFSRIHAAFIVYQISIITFCVSVMQIPYTSLIVSNEKMSIYAFLSILDVVMKLIIVFALTFVESIDRLILYGFLMFIITLLTTLVTIIYCYWKVNTQCRYHFMWDRKLLKEMFAFSSWNLLGGLSGVANTEGPNYFMNYFLGVKLNAAMGVAKQVSGAVYGFSSSFQTAFNPQIVKAYASEDKSYLESLIFRTSKLSFFLIYIITVPILLFSSDILSIWLVSVPDYTNEFCILILIAQLVSAVSSPLWMTAHAIGNIRAYQLALMFFNLSILPATWIFFVLHFEPYFIMLFQIFINLGVLIYRIEYLKSKISFDSKEYYLDICFRLLVGIPLCTIPLFFLKALATGGLFQLFCCILVVAVYTFCLFYVIGLREKEKSFFIQMLKNKFDRYARR